MKSRSRDSAGRQVLSVAACALALAGGLCTAAEFPARGAVEAPVSASTGRAVFVQICAVCHVPGVAQAPRIDMPGEWEGRIALGRQALLHSVLRGKNGMPPKGGNASLSDAEAAAALDYMVARVLDNRNRLGGN